MLTEEGLQAIRETEWFVYVINNPRGTGERFIVTDGMSPFHDEQVKNLLTKDEFIDEVNTLDGRLKGRSEVLNVSDNSLSRLRTERDGRPKIVCLCGSTRFYEEFQRANFRETMLGNIVLTVGFYPHNPFWELNYQGHGEDVGITPEEKTALDELHKRKIDLADEILVLNVGGYIGDSTRSEIEYARAHGKPVRWLEPPHSGMEGEGEGRNG